MISKVGEAWSPQDEDLLIAFVEDAVPPEMIEQHLGRNPRGIECRIQQIRSARLGLSNNFIDMCPLYRNWYRDGVRYAIWDKPKTEEKKMNRAVRQVTFVGDTPADSLTAEKLLDIIEEQQAFVERLEKLQASEAINKQVLKHKLNIKKLSELLAEKLDA